MILSRMTSTTLLLLLCVCVYSQNKSLDEQFLRAVQDRDFAKVELLLKQGANVNAQEDTNGYFALQYAINWPDARLVQLLLEKGVNVNIADHSGYTALIDTA